MRLILFTLIFFSFQVLWAKNDFLGLFTKSKPIIAAIMVEGDLSQPDRVARAEQWSLQQLAIAESKGMDGILYEFRGGKIMKPAISSAHYKGMLKVAKTLVTAAKDIVVGVEILWHYPEETLRLAKDSGARFVRVDFFSDEVIANGQSVPINPEKLLAYRRQIGGEEIALLTDIQVKYSEMVDKKITLAQSATVARSKGSDGVIVSGAKSGTAPSASRPQMAKRGAGELPVVIGSGFSLSNASSLLQYADAAIVGTSISQKTGGPLLPNKVDQLMSKVRDLRKSKVR